MVLNTSVSLNDNKKGTSVSCFEDLWRLSRTLERACIVLGYTSNELCCTKLLLSFVFVFNKKKSNGEEPGLQVSGMVCLWDVLYVYIWFPTCHFDVQADSSPDHSDNRCFLEPSPRCHVWQHARGWVEQPRDFLRSNVSNGKDLLLQWSCGDFCFS